MPLTNVDVHVNVDVDGDGDVAVGESPTQFVSIATRSRSSRKPGIEIV